jgi:hypothetical protein
MRRRSPSSAGFQLLSLANLAGFAAAAAVAGAVSITLAACNRSPSSPSGGDATLRVQVVNDATGTAITDPVFRIELQLDADGRTLTASVVNGMAEFSGVVPDDYRLTTTALFGYLQVDLVTVRVEGETALTLRLAAIDDLGVEQISADGRDVPMGGTIAIPVRGVTLRLRGKYQSPRSPFPAANRFSAQIPSATSGIDGVGHEGGATVGQPISATEFEISIPNWTPCTRFSGNRLSQCFTDSDIIVLTMSTPFDGRFGGAPLIRKSQRWPLKFILPADCCLP